MVKTNFDPSNFEESGLLLERGTSRYNVLRAVTNEIVRIRPDVFEELNDENTPANMSSKKSAIQGPSPKNDDDTNTRLVWKNDKYYKPADGSDSFARILGINFKEYRGNKLHCSILDTASSETEWQNLYGNPLNIGDSISDNDTALFIFPNQTGDEGDDSEYSPLQTDCKFYCWIGDDWICMETRAVVTGRSLGNTYVWIKDEPEDGRWDRKTFPGIYAAALDQEDGEYTSDGKARFKNIWWPGFGVVGASTNKGAIFPELGLQPEFRDWQNREIVQRHHGHFNVDELSGYSFWIGHVPGILQIRNTDNLSKYATKSINGKDYVFLFDADYRRGYLIEQGTTV